MKTINIIGDIAGNYDTLQALIAKMPEGLVVSVGDMIDRGPKSREVLEFFRLNVENGTAAAILGNHEIMMLHALKYDLSTSWRDWSSNGGIATLDSFDESDFAKAKDLAKEFLPFLDQLPVFLEFGELFISHAPWINLDPKDKWAYVWNRYDPLERVGQFSVFGHQWESSPRSFKNEEGKDYAICIDTSPSRVLTGFSWPTREIFQQKTID